MDNLQTRLRGYAKIGNPTAKYTADLLAEAADELDALEADLEVAHDLAVQAVEWRVAFEKATAKLQNIREIL